MNFKEMKEKVKKNKNKIIKYFFVLLMASITTQLSKVYANACETFYEIPKQYFINNSFYMDRIKFLILFIIIFFSYLIAIKVFQKYVIKNKIVIMIYTFLFLLIITRKFYSIVIEHIFPKFLIKYFGIWIVFPIIVLFIYCVSRLLVETEYNTQSQMLQKIKDSELNLVSCAIVFMIILTGILSVATQTVADKRWYEIIDKNQVIVSHYDGKYVVMDCDIGENNLTIVKGSYELIDMTGVKITYQEFNDVVCK